MNDNDSRLIIYQALESHYEDNKNYYNDSPHEATEFITACWEVVGFQIDFLRKEDRAGIHD